MDIKCSICLGNSTNSDEWSFLNCGHAFHEKCIKQWFLIKSPTCPQCRTRNPVLGKLQLNEANEEKKILKDTIADMSNRLAATQCKIQEVQHSTLEAEKEKCRSLQKIDKLLRRIKDLNEELNKCKAITNLEKELLRKNLELEQSKREEETLTRTKANLTKSNASSERTFRLVEKENRNMKQKKLHLEKRLAVLTQKNEILTIKSKKTE